VCHGWIVWWVNKSVVHMRNLLLSSLRTFFSALRGEMLDITLLLHVDLTYRLRDLRISLGIKSNHIDLSL
jgi:hypothetical protein